MLGGIGDSTMRKLYLCAIIMAMSVTSNAQTSHKTLVGEGVGFVPKSLTYDNKACVVSVSEDYCEVSVYDSDLELMRSFTIQQDKRPWRKEELRRKVEVKARSGWTESVLVWATGEIWTGTWGNAKEWAAADIPNKVKAEAKTDYQFWPTEEEYYWKTDAYGKLYPSFYYQWNVEDGTISKVYVEYSEAYTGDWETIAVEEGDYGSPGIKRTYLYDFDNNSWPEESVAFTQTLFNTDERFEYVQYLEEETEWVEEHDDDGDGEPDYRIIHHGWKEAGFRIMSEDGTVLQAIRHDGYLVSDKEVWVCKLNDKLYIVANYWNPEGGGRETVFYKIDQQTTSVNRVKAVPASAKLIYSLDGRQQPTMQRGVNVVRDGDGAVKKVMKK